MYRLLFNWGYFSRTLTSPITNEFSHRFFFFSFIFRGLHDRVPPYVDKNLDSPAQPHPPSFCRRPFCSGQVFWLHCFTKGATLTLSISWTSPSGELVSAWRVQMCMALGFVVVCLFSRIFLFFLLLGVFGCTQGTWKFPGQGSNPSHSSDLRHSHATATAMAMLDP